MASRALLKIKINQGLRLRFLPKTSSILTRSVAPIVKLEAPQPFLKNYSVLGGMTHNHFARQMGTSRSPATPRGSHRVSDKEEDFDEDNDDEFDDDGDTFDIDENDLDDDGDTFDIDENDLDDDGDTFDIDENDLDDDEQEEVEEVAPKKKHSRK